MASLIRIYASVALGGYIGTINKFRGLRESPNVALRRQNITGYDGTIRCPRF